MIANHGFWEVCYINSNLEYSFKQLFRDMVPKYTA